MTSLYVMSETGVGPLDCFRVVLESSFAYFHSGETLVFSLNVSGSR